MTDRPSIADFAEDHFGDLPAKEKIAATRKFAADLREWADARVTVVDQGKPGHAQPSISTTAMMVTSRKALDELPKIFNAQVEDLLRESIRGAGHVVELVFDQGLPTRSDTAAGRLVTRTIGMVYGYDSDVVTFQDGVQVARESLLAVGLR